LAIWLTFAVVGLLLRFTVNSDFYQGLGIALVFFAGVGLLIDGFAERRTHPYMDALSVNAMEKQP
jgi:lipoprotein signal peptidase